MESLVTHRCTNNSSDLLTNHQVQIRNHNFSRVKMKKNTPQVNIARTPDSPRRFITRRTHFQTKQNFAKAGRRQSMISSFSHGHTEEQRVNKLALLGNIGFFVFRALRFSPVICLSIARVPLASIKLPFDWWPGDGHGYKQGLGEHLGELIFSEDCVWKDFFGNINDYDYFMNRPPISAVTEKFECFEVDHLEDEENRKKYKIIELLCKQ